MTYTRGLLFSLVLLIPVPAALAATWPGAAPCNTTLQACIAAASAGDVVQIASNSTISEDLTIDKSLTLEPAPGYTPTLDGYIIAGGSASASDITIQGLSITGGFIRGFPGAGDLSLHILGNTITNAGGYIQGIDISGGSDPSGNVTAEIRDNTLTLSGTGDSCNAVVFGPIGDDGTSSVVIEGNRVTATDCNQGSAIVVNVGGGEVLTADVIGNTVVATNTNDGIQLRNFQQVDGSILNGRIINNTVTGQVNYAGFPGAITVSADGFEAINILVLNNTVAGNGAGIGLSARTDLGASLSGLVANNIAAFNDNWGIYIDDSTSVENRNNLVFGNGDNQFTPGPGTVTEDPMFYSETDFHLQKSSPAIDAGSTDDVPGDITTDIEGSPRIQLAAVDIGAYEAATTGAADVPALDARALAALAVLLAAVAVIALRR